MAKLGAMIRIEKFLVETPLGIWLGLGHPWELTVVNVVLSGIYDSKKIAVIRFSMSVFYVFIFTTYIIVDYF